MNLLEEIEKWSSVYQFSFQFWGDGDNNCWIYKQGVELTSFGGRETIDEVLTDALNWVKEHNPDDSTLSKYAVETRCKGCGCRIAEHEDYCAECLCEDDCYP